MILLLAPGCPRDAIAVPHVLSGSVNQESPLRLAGEYQYKR
ncbi:hypothetical protein [Oscillatoria sp. FACHB-1406]|nr:hypothetical protein [Oscillatoria sp. FACHB-1406]